MFVLSMNKDGKWYTRCNDGLWRNKPWYGTYGICCKFYKSEATAKGALTRINNGLLRAIKHSLITDCAEKNCADIWQEIEEVKCL